jgi:hypothetical protein
MLHVIIPSSSPTVALGFSQQQVIKLDFYNKITWLINAKIELPFDLNWSKMDFGLVDLHSVA